jgi:hypothetical protein
LKKEYFFFWHNVAHKNCSKFGPNWAGELIFGSFQR